MAISRVGAVLLAALLVETLSPAVYPATAVAAPACAATRPDALGPFYKPGAPLRASVGAGHMLTGVVRSLAGCGPIAGARLEFWLAGPGGQYDDNHRATAISDAAGRYRFESNFPPPYAGRPSHIHIRVSAEGYQTLVTQYYPGPGQSQGAFDLVLVRSP
jgi:protocatechuate 3,4-dioxygenase beta subunit